MALFSGEECNDSTVSAIARFYQLSDSVEQSIAPFVVRTELTQGSKWDGTFTAPWLYDYYQNIGYTSTLWGAVTDLGLEPGDMAFKYTSENNTSEWRIARGVVAIQESPDSLGEDMMMPRDYSERALSTSLPDMPDDERRLIQIWFQRMAEMRPAKEDLVLTDNPEVFDEESAWRDDAVRGYERKLKIGKLARERNRYGPTSLRKNNPGMIELNELVNLEGQSHLQDLEDKKS
ncbi:hypothetical protein TWF481_000161 [Arthrobotrys musiformis]|uniref:Uncharacterized protein n=1 Tax=Arthrobotrys musiformis TaxID=47236 RepID=A0AAV9WND5_9PEZI